MARSVTLSPAELRAAAGRLAVRLDDLQRARNRTNQKRRHARYRAEHAALIAADAPALPEVRRADARARKCNGRNPYADRDARALAVVERATRIPYAERRGPAARAWNAAHAGSLDELWSATMRVMAARDRLDAAVRADAAADTRAALRAAVVRARAERRDWLRPPTAGRERVFYTAGVVV